VNLHPITVDRNEARRAFLEYRGAVRASLAKEAELYDDKRKAVLAQQREHDEAVMRGYRQIALGHQIISLRDTIRIAGEDGLHRPKLAIARADNRSVSVRITRGGAVRFFGGSQRSDHRDPRTADSLELPAGTLPGWTGGEWETWANAIAPSIPPRFRPAQLDHYHLLWEATWQRPPVDPALLRAIGDGLYVVVATWDLTALEQAVLGIRST
jgi:hypothetical protein